jgi:KaiC/GvpD/RAD55 family RecA-like ATPase
MLPGKNGIEVCKSLRGSVFGRSLPILILSAKGEQMSKLAGFEAGADDYMTKPFDINELMARVSVHLRRAKAPERPASTLVRSRSDVLLPRMVRSGNRGLDELIPEGIPSGSNILLLGGYGTGKTTICRDFVVEGLRSGEKVLYLALEGSWPAQARNVEAGLQTPLEKFEMDNSFRMVGLFQGEAGAGIGPSNNPSLDELSRNLIDAGTEIGHDIEAKSGGRRVVDSVSTLVSVFGTVPTNNFISNLAHTSISFGGVTTLFTMERGALPENEENSIKNLMDCVVEIKMESIGVYARIIALRWASLPGRKVKLWIRT